MNGPRILLGLLAGMGLLVWLALADDPRRDVDRGLEESGLALAAVEAELARMDGPYQVLSRGRLRLDLKSEHDELRSRLAHLRARRVDLADDGELPRNDVLPAFRELVTEADELLAFALDLGRRVIARHDFIVASTPLLRDGRALRDALLAARPADAVLAERIHVTVGWFSELEGHAARADSLLHQNPAQGQVMAAAALAGLESFQAEASGLLESAAPGR